MNHTKEALRAEIERLKDDLVRSGRDMTKMRYQIEELEGDLFKAEENIKLILYYFLDERSLEIPTKDLDKFYLSDLLEKYYDDTSKED